MDKFQELKEEYGELSKGINEEEIKELGSFLMAASLRVWAANELYSPDYAKALEAISGTAYTTEQVVTAMGCCGEAGRKLQLPKCYKEIVEKDGAKAIEFIGKINSFLTEMAMINGDFTMQEARMLSDVMKAFAEDAAKHGIMVPSDTLSVGKVTPLADGSYLRNDELVREAFEKRRDGGDSAPKITKNDDNSVTLNLVIGQDDEQQEEEFTKEKPEITQPENSDETLESLLAELDSLVGLHNVKQDVHSLMNFIRVSKIREQRGMKVPVMSYHLVFTGNPGTGKTTVARLVARLYYHMGILPKGQLVEADRSSLVAGYLGQTAIKTQKAIQEAMGGVLFIDEAYSLANDESGGDSYGREAIETILKAMEDHRDELVVIVAGYIDLMHQFIDSNPGLSSRFSKYFEFQDYSSEELLLIFKRFCDGSGYTLSPDGEQMLLERLIELYTTREEHFGNARAVRNIFEKAINAQANRIAEMVNFTDEDLEMLTAEDISAATR